MDSYPTRATLERRNGTVGTNTVIAGQSFGFPLGFALNNLGTVAFTTRKGAWVMKPKPGDGGRYKAPEGVTLAGAVIEGKKVSYIGQTIAINDFGRIAVQLRFTDGTGAIIIANR
jgi:hypothetical protein